MRTLRQQLLLVNLATVSAAILMAVVLMFSAELRTWKQALVQDIAIKADIIGNQCSAALLFNAPKDAEEILGALRADDQIEFAAIYTKGGMLFAAYRKGQTSAVVPGAAPMVGHAFGSDHLDLTRPILLHAEEAGLISIRVRLEHLHAVLFKYVTVSVAVLLLALLVASALLIRLQRTVTAPVTALVRLMERVSRDKDYSRRAEGAGPTELVSLAGSFNDMLAAIQNRDRDLERSLAELQDAYRKLEDLDRLKSDFISTVSHELRTPITSIKAFAELLAIRPGMIQSRKERILNTITAESDRLARLINDLLDLSRIESGVMQWRDHDMSVADVVRDAVAGVLPLAQKKHIGIVDRGGDGLPMIHADRDRIMQVVMNLLSNAIKFTPEGGTITVKTFRTGPPSGIAVSVEDTGTGIPSADLASIFERFRRSGDVLTQTEEGTGLGLAICRQIVEHYGGRISVTSEEGNGSIFTFVVPLNRPPSPRYGVHTDEIQPPS